MNKIEQICIPGFAFPGLNCLKLLFVGDSFLHTLRTLSTLHVWGKAAPCAAHRAEDALPKMICADF
eukprot:4211823-Amphidinium_carterae.1